MKSKVSFARALPLVAFLAFGCHGSAGPDAAVAQDSATPGAAGVSVAPGKKINGATAVDSPTANIPAGGIVLQPRDQNDPHFKPDPKLSGGG